MICVSFQIRVLGILVALGATFVIRRGFGIPLSNAVPIIFALWLATCLLYLAAIRRAGSANARKLVDRLHFSYYFFGIAYVTGLVHYLGGVEWVAFVLYVFDIV